MIIQLSSGVVGPLECRVGVGGIARALMAEFPDLEIITGRKGEVEGAYSSLLLSTEQDLSYLAGTMEWICPSPYRPGHKRKNWFIDVSVIPEADEIGAEIRNEDVRVEKFHSGGHGGQNVNKVETGVRITHIPTGIVITSTKERSQYMNKQDALKKLSAVLKRIDTDSRDKQKNEAWSKHAQIVRGNPVRVYIGEEFKLRNR
ncbi:MAG: peptide chain release factor-like protein [Lachnospiraceae bacterium]|nr:peptide chain release factor-like protein [Lachnospiraceae bacterium]